MTALRALQLAVAAAVLLSGCGRTDDAPAGAAVTPAAAPNADVIVTVDDKTQGCMVALAREAQGSAVACDDVLPFVRDELRVPRGSIYAVRAAAHSDRARVAKVDADLQGAGYRSSGAPGRP